VEMDPQQKLPQKQGINIIVPGSGIVPQVGWSRVSVRILFTIFNKYL